MHWLLVEGVCDPTSFPTNQTYAVIDGLCRRNHEPAATTIPPAKTINMVAINHEITSLSVQPIRTRPCPQGKLIPMPISIQLPPPMTNNDIVDSVGSV